MAYSDTFKVQGLGVDAEGIASEFERILEPRGGLSSQGQAYRPAEEVASAISHGIGALLGIAGLVLILVRASLRADATAIASLSIYGGSMILLYLMSTLYHALRHPGAKGVFKVLDHASIYLLIAGTYTAFAPGIIRGHLGWGIFGIVWACAALGVSLEAFWVNRPKILSAMIYVLMGWIVVLIIGPVKEALGPASFGFLLAGGIVYSLGAILYAWKRLPWSHPLFHLFVLGGSLLHFAALWTVF
jgi:hemolysin III